MTTLHEDAVTTWPEPDSGPLRGTLIVFPGRGESPEVYERFGRRLATDSYRVHAVTAPSEDPARTEDLLAALLGASETAGPRVLVGSDAGALYAALLVAQSRLDAVSGLILAGLPSVDAPASSAEWDGELEARTSCPTHRARLSAGRVRPGELYADIPAAWFEGANPERIDIPVLGLHGSADAVSPLAAVRPWFARAPHAELVSINGGRHDALNDQTHRSVAAIVVMFLERLRLDGNLTPITRVESLRRDGAVDRG